MSKKHFIAMAETISKISDLDERRKQAEFQAEFFAAQNPRFDFSRFYAACNINSIDA